MRKVKSYWNPYFAGIGLGITLLFSFIIMGRGLGASGAFSSVVSYIVDIFAPLHSANNEVYSAYIGEGTPLKTWLVFEILGVIIGGFVSGYFSGRIKIKVEKGKRITVMQRLFYAFIGGGLMGFGAKLARGCTSGQGLTGAPLLNVGSWIFLISLFISGYIFSVFIKRLWK